jgi:hypothetical protein
MVAGIPVIVPEGTWLATAAPEGAHAAFGPGVTLVEAARRAIADHDALSAAALAAQHAARQRHDAEKLMRALTNTSEVYPTKNIEY